MKNLFHLNSVKGWDRSAKANNSKPGDQYFVNSQGRVVCIETQEGARVLIWFFPDSDEDAVEALDPRLFSREKLQELCLSITLDSNGFHRIELRDEET